MKLGVLTAGVIGAALIAGGPTAVWLVAHDKYGGRGDSKVEHRSVQRHDRDDKGGEGRGFRPMRPLPMPMPMRPPTGELRQRLQDFKKYLEWQQCVVNEARKSKGSFDPTKVCGAAPALPKPPTFSMLPPIPEKPRA
jgi:hypothetical protein